MQSDIPTLFNSINKLEVALISSTAIIYPNVVLGQNVTIEDFVIVGCPPANGSDSELETHIGDDSIIRAGTIIYAGNSIGNSFQTGNKANIREFNKIGNNVSIGTLSVVEHHVEIGNNVRIHSQVFVPEYSKLCQGAWLGPNVVLTNAKYPTSNFAKQELDGAIVGKQAVIGANATIMPGVVVGSDSIVGAGSVVTKDVISGSVVRGNPATHFKFRSDIDSYST